MSRKVIKKTFAGLCFGLGLMACTQNIEQEKYPDLIIGLEGNEINLYPLGDQLTLPVTSASEWDVVNFPEWVRRCAKSENAVDISVDSNHTGNDHDGMITIRSADGMETYINLYQEAFRFELSDKDGHLIKDGDDFGNELELYVDHNVFYDFDSSEFVIDTIPSNDANRDKYSIAARLDGAFNTDNAATKDFNFFIYDKEREETLKSLSITFKQDVFYFYFDKQGYVRSKSKKVGFEGGSFSYDFVSSEKPNYDAPEFSNVSIVDREDNNYEMSITVKPNTGAATRRDTLSFYTTYGKGEDYILQVSIEQAGQPKVELTVGGKVEYELPDTETATFELKVDGKVYSGESLVLNYDTDVIDIIDNKITPKSLGETTLIATVTVNGVELKSNPVNIRVVREYSSGSGEEIGDDTEDEW